MKYDRENIRLVGAFEAPDTRAGAWRVTGIYVERESYVPDVYVELDRAWPGLEDGGAELYEDPEFLGAVMAQLRAAGYEGEDFGRAELGAQSTYQVVLEPNRSFERFAMSKGWRYADGLDEYELSAALSDAKLRSLITFRARDGSRWGLPLCLVAERHARQHAAANGVTPARSLVDVTVPLLRATPAAAVKWADEHLTAEELKTHLRLLESAPELDLHAEWKRCDKRVVWRP